MGQLIQGFRVGVPFSTASGMFRNGNEPSKEQRRELSEAGYKFAPYIATPEEQAAIKHAHAASERLGILT